MKQVKIFMLLMILLFTCSIAQAKSNPATTVRTSGSAHITAIPDRAILTVGVVNTAENVKDVQENNAKISGAVIEAISSLGINKDKMRTSQFTVYPVYNDQDKNDKNEITGYRATNIVTITLDDTAMVGTVVETALKSGANEINGIHYQKRDEQELKQKALEAAVKDASAKAEAIAQALGRHLGRVVSAEDSGVSIQAPDMQRYYVKAASSNSFLPGSMEVTASVTVTYEMD
jgi:uncharacterized protein YggE